MIFLLLVPWVLTIVALMAIMLIRKKPEAEEDDFIMDEHSEIIKVLVQEHKAYWVHNHILYESEVTKEPDFETAKPIDTMTLSSKEMNELFKILDDLEESNEGE